jgi:predicted RNA-binding protein with PIN domain
MPLIIDTMNVLHVTGVLPPDLAGLDVGDLAELIRLSRYRTQQASLVCDGTGAPGVKAGRAGLITIRFSGKGRSADDVIREMVARSSTPRRLLVVTSDNAVLRAARRRRCDVITSDSFLKQIAADVRDADRPLRKKLPSKPAATSMSAEQVNKWIDIFNADVDAISRQVDAMQPRKADAAKEPAKPRGSKSRLRGHIRKIDSEARTKRGRANRTAKSKDRDPPKPVVPKDFIAEAERMVQEFEASRKSRHKRNS